METTRETKELKTSGGHVVTYKAWISGREFNAIQSVYLKSVNVTMVSGQPQVGGIDPSVNEQAVSKLIEMLVVSIDGVTAGALDKILDLPVSDYNEIVAVLQEVNSKKN